MNRDRAPAFRELPAAARLYLAGAAPFAGAATIAASLLPQPELDPLLLGLTIALCGASGLFEAIPPRHYSLQPGLAFFVLGVLLLPAWSIPILAVACYLPPAVVQRPRWYLPAFNVLNLMLAGAAARGVLALGPDDAVGSLDIAGVAMLAAVGAVIVAVNHGLIVVADRLARHRPWRVLVRDAAAGMPLDWALTSGGACLAVLWAQRPVLVLLAIGPGLLVHHALSVPLLRHKSRTDAKTGLFNSEHLTAELARALTSARRYGGDVAVVMIDIDHLRAVNNRNGHLAGDELLREIARIVADDVATDGVAARFGGDELCLLLPNVSAAAARLRADSLRQAIGALELELDDGDRLRITASVGVAAYPEHGATPNALLEAADTAVYDAKLGGRDRVRVALPPGAETLVTSNGDAPPEHGSAPNGSPPADAASVELAASARSDTLELDPEDPPEAPPAPAARAHERAVSVYAVLLLAVAVAIGALERPHSIPDGAVVFVALVVSVIVLDIVRIDLFERATISPSAVPTLGLAFLFGPFGPVAAEAVAALVNLVRRKAAVKTAFDFGALSIAGTVAALVFAAMPTGTHVGLLAASAVGGLVYYATNVPLLALVMALSEGTSPLAAWRERLAWLWPHYVGFGLLAGTFTLSERELGPWAFAVFGLPLFMMWVAEKQYVDRSRESVAELREKNEEMERANVRLHALLHDNRALIARMQRSYLTTITSLARTIEAKDPYTGGHTERVAEFARLLAVELGFSGRDLQAVHVGALIHDIGKIGVPDRVLLKPGKLDEDEFAEIRRHPEISSYIVADLDLPAIVKQMVRSHHERFDGRGYPDRLAGEEIPLAARVLAVADALDAMTSDRPYRKALPLVAALAEIQAQAGAQFCPRVVGALNDSFARDPEPWGVLGRAETETPHLR